MKELLLKGLNEAYIKTNENDKYEVYWGMSNNNFILFTPYDDCDVDSICNGIGSQAYSYLINKLNNNKNVVVEWSQVEGTTSDYDIYYDVKVTDKEIDSYLKIKDLLKNYIKQSSHSGYKYRQIKDGIMDKIEFS